MGGITSIQKIVSSNSPKKKSSKTKKVFLALGGGGCGKSTICKQMVNSSQGFSEEAKLEFATQIYTAISSAVLGVLNAYGKMGDNSAEKIDLGISDEDLTEVEEILQEGTALTPSDPAWPTNLKAMKRLWDDIAFQAVKTKVVNDCGYELDVLHKACDFYLEDVKFEEISKLNYAPSAKDIMRTRQATTTETDYEINTGSRDFILRDVGGQIHLREGWTTAFIGANAVLYICALDSYGSVDSSGKNEFLNALKLARLLVASELLRELPFIVVFNKKDLFEEMIKTKPLSTIKGFKCRCSKNDKQGCAQEKDACFCLEKFFMEALKKEHRKALDSKPCSDIQSYRTCALDSKLTTSIIVKIVQSILETNMMAQGWS